MCKTSKSNWNSTGDEESEEEAEESDEEAEESDEEAAAPKRGARKRPAGFFSVDYRRCTPVCLYACVTHIHFHIHTKEAYLLHCYWCTHIKQQLQQHQRRQQIKKEEDVQRSRRKVDFFESGGMGVAAYIHTGMYRPTYIHTYIHTYKHTHTYTRRHICLLSNWATPLPTPHPNMHYWN